MDLLAPAVDPAGPTKPSVPPRTAAQLAAATPAARDRYMDLLRVVAIGVVVVGHWLMAVLEVGPSGIRANNALAEISGAPFLTWFFQVMPVFFFVGGFAHATGLRSLERRGGGYADFVRARVARLLRPTAVFLGAWVVVAAGLELAGAQTGAAKLISATVVQPLWFVGVYLGVVALAPLMYRWHRRHGAAVPVVLLLATAAVDYARFGLGLGGIGTLNLVFVWLAAHQLGYLYADGKLTRLVAAAMAVGGLTAVAVLTVGTRLYPVSMVGLPGERISNMSPPTLALAAHATWLVGLVLLVRGPLTRWLAGRRVWTAVVAANGVVMTTFLWHLTALFALYGVVLAIGLPLPAAGTAAWVWTRPLWLGVLALLTAGLVLLFRRAERQGGSSDRPADVGVVRAAVGGAVACVGMFGVALTGLDGLLAGRVDSVAGVPMTAGAGLGMVALGWALLAAPRPGPLRREPEQTSVPRPGE